MSSTKISDMCLRRHSVYRIFLKHATTAGALYLCTNNDITMSSTEIITASQARYVNQYKNLKIKVMKCCANIYFNRQCLKQNQLQIVNGIS
jgi:hypothetical protein